MQKLLFAIMDIGLGFFLVLGMWTFTDMICDLIF